LDFTQVSVLTGGEG